MLLFIKNYVLHKSDEEHLSWLFLYSKKSTLTGLVFLFFTYTALSLVDRLYFAAEYYAGLPNLIPTHFGFDVFFRLVLVPLFNLGAIAYCAMVALRFQHKTDSLTENI
jgi:hypothetical protein